MQLGKVKPTATIVAQFAAGVEVDAIQHEGKIFLPAIAIGDFAGDEPAPERTKEPTPESAPSKPSKASKETKAETKSPSKTYTKDEMMEMKSSDLEKILKKEFGIDPDDYDGKNTNKKLRDLILEAQKKAKSAPVKGKDEDEEEEENEGNDELVKKVASLLTDFDGGKLSRKKAVAAIADACEAEADDVNDLLDKFEDDSDATPEDFAQTIVDELAGGGDAGGSTEEPDGEEVDASDLEKGDKVAVWWDDDNQAWFTGVVDSVKRGKVHIKYDDGTDDDIDPEIHTVIKKIK